MHKMWNWRPMPIGPQDTEYLEYVELGLIREGQPFEALMCAPVKEITAWPGLIDGLLLEAQGIQPAWRCIVTARRRGTSDTPSL